MNVDTLAKKIKLQSAFNYFLKCVPFHIFNFLGVLLYREASTNYISRECWCEITRKINNCRSGSRKPTSRLWEVQLVEYADDMAPVVALDALKSPRHESYSPRRAHSLSRSGSQCSQSQKMSNYTVAFSLTVFSNLHVSLGISDQPYGVKDPSVSILSPQEGLGPSTQIGCT